MSEVRNRWADVVTIAKMTNPGAEYDPKQTYGQALRLAVVELDAELGRAEAALLRIANECNCRAEHGADGAEHLLAIEKMLRAAAKEGEK